MVTTKVGIETESPDSGGDTRSNNNDNNFTVSLSETTDGGITVSSSFMLLNENGSGGDMDAGLTLAFTDGSKLDVINAGNASGSHAISVPGSAGSEGITLTTVKQSSNWFGLCCRFNTIWCRISHCCDFLVDGLKMSFSASTDDGATQHILQS